jgi:hypothetical protein
MTDSTSSPGEETADYNRLFETFVDLSRPEGERLQGLVAYALYKTAKREWAADVAARSRRRPTEEELANYQRTWTPTLIASTRQQAEQALAVYAETVIEDATPEIRESAIRGSFGKDVRAGVAAAFIYTILLVVIAVILRLVGVDALGVFEKIRPVISASEKPGLPAESGMGR